MKIASMKNETPSSAKPTPNTSANVAMKFGHSRPNSNDRIVPVTTPTAKIVIATFDQRLASALYVRSPVRRYRPSTNRIIAGNAIPKQTMGMCTASDSACMRRAMIASGPPAPPRAPVTRSAASVRTAGSAMAEPPYPRTGRSDARPCDRGRPATVTPDAGATDRPSRRRGRAARDGAAGGRRARGRLAGPARRRAAPRRAAPAPRPALPRPRAVVRQPAHGARERADRRAHRGQPEHDVSAAALARAAGPRPRRVGAPRAPLAALLPPHAGGRGRARPARGRGRAAPRRGRRRHRPHPPRAPRLAMGRVSARVDVPGQASEAEALWYDTRRWPAFVDGCKHVARIDGEWPREGARVVWDSYPDGRGRVLERVVAYEARVGQSLEVEDEKIRGTQRVSFVPRPGGVTVSLGLDYELKEQRGKFGAFDLLFVRRPQREALQRTLHRFAREVRADRDPGL